MTPEKTEYLLKTYPNLYKRPIYFECYDGWFDLINELSAKLEKIILEMKQQGNLSDDSAVLDDADHFYAMQVKEKYGGLRFYMNWHYPEMMPLIDKAYRKSLSTCELCGKLGKCETHENGWVYTRCEDCRS
jgi:hypothetical protein